MHSEILFVRLYLVIAAGVAALLLWRSVRRGLYEIQSRGRILLAAVVALAVWAAATYYMLFMTFVTVWGLAHTRPVLEGMFPEGWGIYAFLAAYAALGVVLLIVVGRMPRKRLPA